MNQKLFYAISALVAVALISLSLVWPQGLGARSPSPFGHPAIAPDYYRMVRDREARLAKQAADKAAQAKLEAATEKAASASSSAASLDSVP